LAGAVGHPSASRGGWEPGMVRPACALHAPHGRAAAGRLRRPRSAPAELACRPAECAGQVLRVKPAVVQPASSPQRVRPLPRP
jgi:hypothetical protein